MKKFISVLVAMLMILSSVSAFAAVEADLSHPSNVYFNNLNSYADGVITGPFGVNPDHPTDYRFQNGQFVVSRKDGSATTGLTYVYFGGSYTYDSYAFGYDVKFSNVTDVKADSNGYYYILNNTPGTENTVITDAVQANIDSGKYYIDDKGNIINSENGKTVSKTSWCFYKTGNAASFTARKSGDEFIKDSNGKIAIFLGSAKLDQDATYTLKIYCDNINRTYRVVAIDAAGNMLETGLSGTYQNAFYGLNKIDASLATLVDDGAEVTFDNLFVTKNTLALTVGETTEVASNGTIRFGATLPAYLANPAVYINDTFVENITLNGGAYEDYSITAALPEGTVLGNAKIEIRGTIDGAPVSVSANTTITKTYKTFTKVLDTPSASGDAKGLRGVSGAGKMNVAENDPGVWALTNGGLQIDVTHITPALTGIVDYSFDFKSDEYINQIRLRMTANTSNGGAMKWNGGSDTYHYFSNGYPYAIGTKKIPYELGDWNTLRVRADYYNHRYYAYINGTLAEEGTFTDVDGPESDSAATSFVDDVRFMLYMTDLSQVTYLDNFTFNEYKLTSQLAAPTATVKYASGNSALYEGTELNALGVNGFDFATPVAFDAASINSANVKIVNSAGEVVPATFSFANGVISAAYAGNTLPTDSYKLIVGKNATINGEAVGANYEVPFALNSDDRALIEEGAVITDKINLSAFANNATKVVFKVDDETVKTFAAAEADGVYEFLYTPSVAGEHIFDAYVYSANGVNVVSSPFYYLVDAKMLEGGNDINSGSPLQAAAASTITYVDGAGLDGSRAAKLVSKVGTIKDGVTNTDASNSNTGSVGPGSGLYRIWALEFEIKPEANTYVTTEIGYSLTGQTYAANTASYKTLYVRGSQPALLGANGTILGTSEKFTAGTWYKFKQIINFEDMTCTWYVNDEFFIKDDISGLVSGSNATAYPNWKDNIVVTQKYKICVHPMDRNLVPPSEANPEGLPATIYLDNYKRWHPVETPVVNSITAGGAAIVNNVIANGTDAVTVTLDKDFYALAANNIAVTVDGEAVGTVSVTDTKTFTVSGLAGIEAGKKIEIRILKNNLSVPFNNNTAAVKSDYVFYIYVGDGNKVCLYPLSVESATGNDLTGYSKYINGGATALNTYLIMTEYANDDKSLVAQTNFAPVIIKAGKVGAVSGYLSGVAKAEGCQVMLWNTDFAPILEAGGLAQ